MRLSKRTSKAIGCLWLLSAALLIISQTVFLTLKFSGAVSWSWWAILTPTFCLIALPIAFIVIAVLVLAPKVLIENRRRRKRVEAEAKKYGMEREPGESIGDLKKRIVRRNMITGNYTRKEIKDEILKAFPYVGSCQILVNNQNNEIVLIPRRVEIGDTFTPDELLEIAEFAAQYIPIKYTIAIQNVENKEDENNGNTEN